MGEAPSWAQPGTGLHSRLAAAAARAAPARPAAQTPPPLIPPLLLGPFLPPPLIALAAAMPPPPQVDGIGNLMELNGRFAAELDSPVLMVRGVVGVGGGCGDGVVGVETVWWAHTNLPFRKRN